MPVLRIPRAIIFPNSLLALRTLRLCACTGKLRTTRLRNQRTRACPKYDPARHCFFCHDSCPPYISRLRLMCQCTVFFLWPGRSPAVPRYHCFTTLGDHAHTFPECNAPSDLCCRILGFGVVPNGIQITFTVDVQRVIVCGTLPRTHACIATRFQQRLID